MASFEYVKPQGRVIAEASSRLDAVNAELKGNVLSDPSEIRWQWSKFSDLSVRQLYEMIALRERVFVVEQNCVYLDCDGKDLDCWHLLGWLPASGQDGSGQDELVGYLRTLPPGLRFAELSIGRVVVSPEYRRLGIGKLLMQTGIGRAHETFGPVPIRIAAQAHLERFYTDLGFLKDSDEFLEDDIPHIEMILKP
jgi:ElaA protein